jgi:hypothetical protein
MAFWNRPVRAGLAIAQMAATSAAVISVMTKVEIGVCH